MRLSFLIACGVSGACILAVTPNRCQAQVTTWNSQSTFGSTFSLLTVETFTSGYHSPLGTSLNSSTSITPAFGSPINPGDIQPGVTYSVGTGPLLIDQGGAYTGGFLDGVTGWGTAGPLTITFSSPVGEFGFLTDYHMNWSNFGGAGPFSVLVNYGGGSSQLFNYSSPVGMVFLGYSRPSNDIMSAVVGATGPVGNIIFAMDDFTFGPATETTVPEPATMTLLATGLVGLVGTGLRRRRKG